MAETQKKYMNTTDQIKITGVPAEMKNQVQNVASHMEEDVSGILRSVLKNWLASLPDKLKTKPVEF